MKTPKYIYLTPTPVRMWHWLNALGIVTLCITGAQIRFPEYVNIFGSYKAAISLHNTAGIVVSISYLLWLVYYLIIAGSLVKLYVPRVEDFKYGMIRQGLYYCFYYFLGRPSPHAATPENKFNPLQKSAYLVIMLALMPLVVFSGLLLMNIAPLRTLVVGLGGVTFLISAHFLIACSFCAFLCTHIYLATLGHTPFAHFKPMWTGWEKVEHHDDTPPEMVAGK